MYSQSIFKAHWGQSPQGAVPSVPTLHLLAPPPWESSSVQTGHCYQTPETKSFLLPLLTSVSTNDLMNSAYRNLISFDVKMRCVAMGR